MKKFKDFKYKRINMEDFKVEFNELLNIFRDATSFEQEDNAMKNINVLRNKFESMAEIVGIRNSIDTNDEFYEKQQEYVDENFPIYQGLVTEYYKIINKSEFITQLKEKWGKQIFRIIDLELKSFKSEIIEDLQKENKLGTEYSKLRASAKIEFDGEIRNLSQMGPFTQSEDRTIRINAQKAYNNFFAENEEKFDKIYDELVKVRNKIAITLGFKNYVELGYARLSRSDYDHKMVSNYRKQVYEEIVPLSIELRNRQASRLKVDKLKYYDEPLEFLTGNAKPKGSPEWIVNNGKKMYSELSKETDEFFNFMLENELMDLNAKKGKSGGGYCTYISDYKSPFIFSNFNGTSDDIDVLTHEAGHAFQVFSSREFELPEYIWPTLEACEIHSMSMEFLTWPWMENFFEDDVEKYKFSHLSGALLFIPYGVTVDEFQHWVYENPEATSIERKKIWREIEKKYLPTKDYDDNEFLENGGFWFRQGHIFNNPFYYIDYTLAQVCAFEFFAKSQENREETWNNYLRLCKAGGSKSFLELLKLAKLKNPFENGAIKEIIKPIKNYLENVNDLDM